MDRYFGVTLKFNYKNDVVIGVLKNVSEDKKFIEITTQGSNVPSKKLEVKDIQGVEIVKIPREIIVQYKSERRGNKITKKSINSKDIYLTKYGEKNRALIEDDIYNDSYNEVSGNENKGNKNNLSAKEIRKNEKKRLNDMNISDKCQNSINESITQKKVQKVKNTVQTQSTNKFIENDNNNTVKNVEVKTKNKLKSHKKNHNEKNKPIIQHSTTIDLQHKLQDTKKDSKKQTKRKASFFHDNLQVENIPNTFQMKCDSSPAKSLQIADTNKTHKDNITINMIDKKSKKHKNQHNTQIKNEFKRNDSTSSKLDSGIKFGIKKKKNPNFAQRKSHKIKIYPIDINHIITNKKIILKIRHSLI
ncbi:hypothetical protein EDEG_00560 [Edhazardia aedis USNM 41457]|uniref:Uncharacterized protein n=1 Tax=Edhazardia aedis (strain USNM 41457) TaxID=1003232 RepID=J9DIN3_EDHAE|nr:hypothetical protein EDEG_00560 [Edhazardia aedis USNM 41457]|eukprot:EJW01227.1 hypothetical protein EDEG_00560 [Edhazardia aedis USNM 41457]